TRHPVSAADILVPTISLHLGFVTRSTAPQLTHAFPTRRSSDLRAVKRRSGVKRHSSTSLRGTSCSATSNERLRAPRFSAAWAAEAGCPGRDRFSSSSSGVAVPAPSTAEPAATGAAPAVWPTASLVEGSPALSAPFTSVVVINRLLLPSAARSGGSVRGR